MAMANAWLGSIGTPTCSPMLAFWTLHPSIQNRTLSNGDPFGFRTHPSKSASFGPPFSFFLFSIHPFYHGVLPFWPTFGFLSPIRCFLSLPLPFLAPFPIHSSSKHLVVTRGHPFPCLFPSILPWGCPPWGDPFGAVGLPIPSSADNGPTSR